MELVEEPSVLRRFIRLLQEPFSRIKERWLSYFAHLAMDDDPSEMSLDVENQSHQDQDEKKDDSDDDGNGKKKRKQQSQNQMLSRGSTGRSTPQQDPQEGKPRDKGTEHKEGPMEELELENHQPGESKKVTMDIPAKLVPMAPPAGRPKMMYKITVTAMGATIGLSHLWRLPNMAYKLQSGNFIIIYSALVLIFSLPLYFISLSCGQYASQGALRLHDRTPLLQGVGLSMVFYAYVAAVYQMQTTGFGVHYLVSSFELDLPWTKCDSSNNGTFGSLCFETTSYLRKGDITVECANDVVMEAEYDKLCSKEDSQYKTDFVEECCGSERIPGDNSLFVLCEKYIFTKHCPGLTPPAMQFWQVKVVRPFSSTDPPSGFLGITNLRLVLCGLGASVLVYVIVLMGFKRTVYISMFVIPLMFAALIVLVVSTFRIQGSFDGLLKLVKPDVDSLQNTDVWYAAVEQSLYTLGLGMSLVVGIGSISPFNNSTLKTSVAVTFAALVANILSACLVFAVSGAAASEWNKPFHEVVNAGLGTAYVVYSQALAQLPLPWLFSPIFFALFALTGACSISGLLSSVIISISEMINLTVRDTYVLNFLVVFSCFLLGIPITMRGGLVFIDALDAATAAFSGPTIVTLEVITLFSYGFKFFCEDTAFMLGFNPAKWLLPVTLVFPLGITCALTFKLTKYQMPEWNIWARATAFGSLGLILAPIILVFCLRLCIPVRSGSQSVVSVGPKFEQHKIEREEFRKRKTGV